MKKFHALILLHSTVVILGFTGVLGKAINANAFTITGLRMVIGALGLILWLLLSKKKSGSSNKKQIIAYLLTGIIIAAHWVTFFHAIKLSNVSVALVGIATSTLFVALLEPIFFKRKILIHEILLGLLIIVGLVVIFNIDTKYVLGLIWAIVSAFLASLFTVINGLFVQKNDAATISAFELTGGTVSLFLFAFCFDTNLGSISINQLDSWDWSFLVLLGLLCTSFAFSATTAVMKKLSAYTVAMAINLEPIYSIILACWIFKKDEIMSIPFYSGAAIIILAVFLNGIFGKRFTR